MSMYWVQTDLHWLICTQDFLGLIGIKPSLEKCGLKKQCRPKNTRGAQIQTSQDDEHNV